jgi:hypothetical protein
LFERSINVANQRIFIEQNIEDFLGLLWSKYVLGQGKMRQRQGSKFVRVELTEADIGALIKAHQSHSKRSLTEPGDALRARPIKGAIDYAELSREHIARYPKIRARLAE